MSPQRVAAPRGHAIDALAPVTLVAAGFAELSGVAVERSGALLVTDRVAGTLSRIDASGQSEAVLRDLRRPQDVAVSALGDVFVLEAGAGRVLQIHPDGRIIVAAGDLRQPRGLALAPDGTIWIAIQGQGGDVVARVDESGALTPVLSRLPAVRAMAVAESALFIATQTSVERVRMRPDGTAGGVTPILQRWHAAGIVVDWLGDLYISGWPVGDGGASRAGILKYEEASGRTTRFATGLRQPGALAFEASGHLLAAEGQPHGRLWRFIGPAAPVASIPRFTNASVIAVTGTADSGARVQAFSDGDVQAVAAADESTGRFMMTVTVATNGETTLELVATQAGGAGLAGPASTSLIQHDDRLPVVTLTSPSAAAYLRDAVTLAASAIDEGSGMASINFLLDDIEIAGTEAANGESPLSASAVVDLRQTVEGMHTLTAIATDRAGNQSTAAQLVMIDRTAPETILVEHPGPNLAERAATFTFSGLDVLSPALEFSWRLDTAEWSPYQPGTHAAFERLEAGRHTFEVRARDLAGNEDLTPARWQFQVVAVQLNLAEPLSGAVVTTPTVWVRGEASGTPPVTVSIPLPPELGVVAAAVTAPVVGGRFAVEVPVLPGGWSMAVTASDSAGASVTGTVELQVSEPVTARTPVMAIPSAGFVPHRVRFGVVSLPEGMYTVDLESDGTIEYSGDRPDGREFTYGTAGAFLATIAAATPDGASLQWRVLVTAYDRAVLEAELRAAWRGLKDALRGGELDQAAAFIHSNRRAVWREYFAQLGAAISTEVDAVFTDLDLAGFEGDRVECDMMRAVDGLMFSFPVSFARDTDGRWRLWQF